ncbi:hypothetical protein [Pseudomonas sp. NPDC089734]|uniref:hypothetical protein n=1 Tax=Pseudomonas sp. NPDC089734 TaxID=3364469 RepID=UPI0037FC9BD7
MNTPDSWPELDQAAGLRRWAEQNRTHHPVETPTPTPRPDRTLMLYGSAHLAGQARQTLERWHRQGHKWIGHPDRWHVQPVDKLSDKNLQHLRWGLWIKNDPDAFRQTFRTLRQFSEHKGPNCLLALHEGFASQDGLLNNLREAARHYLGIRLLVVDEWTR